MKKFLLILVSVLMLLSFTGCTSEKEVTPDNDGPVAREKKTVLISDSSMAADFDQVIWRGFTMLQSQGWSVKCIEALESGEYEEDIRSMCEAGYELIFIKGDAIASVLVDIGDDIHAKYPNAYFVMIDSYLEHDLEFAVAVPCDPYEPSFIGGYVAALTSETGEVGWIGHMDTVNLARFRNGYIAGAQYANPDVTVHVGFTGDFYDPIKGQEAVKTMHNTYPDCDVIAHAAYISGNGVLTECGALGIKCIGCDNWQGDKGETVFWSTLKPCDLMVNSVANRWLNGEEKDFGTKMSYNISTGAVPYDARDLGNLPEEVAQKVEELLAGIKDGTIDPFYGEFASYKLDY